MGTVHQLPQSQPSETFRLIQLYKSCPHGTKAGSLSSSDVSFSPSRRREPAGLPVFSDDDTDLIRELQTMCSSRSEPDISKISQTRDHLIGFSRDPLPPDEAKQRPTVQQQLQTAPVVPPGSAQSSERRPGPRGRSQLPVPSSRGQQARAPTCSNNNQTAPPSRRRKPVSASSSNNFRNNVNDSSRSQQDIWILHTDLHESSSSQ